ncbi:hypothetical protein TNCV_2783161 [Trichonephila clavipes]|nr:hypothetical protein TNCV_2783161 [Trichonephila clavipes]
MVEPLRRLYAERHPVRRTPAHTMFARLHQQLCETGSFQKSIVIEIDGTYRIERGNCTYGRDHSRFKYTSGTCSNELQIPFLQPPCCSQMRRLFRRGYFQYNSHSWAAVNPHVTRTPGCTGSFLVNEWAGILGDHLKGPYILPDRLTGSRLDILGTSFARVIGQRTRYRCDSYFHMVPAKMEPTHISVFLFGITWMQHVVNNGLAVEVQYIGLPDRQTFPVWIISSGANEILGVRNTRKQRRGACSTHQCSSRGNTKHSRNVIECSTLHEAKM